MGDIDSEDNSEITITYESLFEIVRLEKNRDELQKLDNDFYAKVASYIAEKQALLDKDIKQDDLFGNAEKERARLQADNIKRLAREIFERRQKKILFIALNQARTASNIVNTSSMLDTEKDFYYRVLELFKEYSVGILTQLLNGKSSNVAVKKPDNPVPKRTVAPEDENLVMPEKSSHFESDSETGVASPKNDASESSMNIMIRFLQSVPKFVGKELEVYGPFQEEDVANLPKEIVELLIKKGKAEVLD